MSNPVLQSTTSDSPQSFTFTWRGGFSYLTYLKKTCKAALSDQALTLETQSFALGAFALRPKTAVLPLATIRGVSTGSQINFFDLSFSILFVILTLISMKLWFLIVTAVFLFRTFNTCIHITDHQGQRISILTHSKDEAHAFVQALSQLVNQQREAAVSAEMAPATFSSPVLQPLVPAKDSGKLKKVFLFSGAAVLALIILFFGLLSHGASDNPRIAGVREGIIPGTNLTMAQVLENKDYFSSVEWSEVQEEGNRLDQFVMYESIYSDQGVKVAVRTVFQVFGEGHFQAVEAYADGEWIEISDWLLFLADLADRTGFTSMDTNDHPQTDVNEPKQVAATIVDEPKPEQTARSSAGNEARSPVNSSFSRLADFTKWSMFDPDITLPLELDGTSLDVIVGKDHPIGIKLNILDRELRRAWELPLSSETDSPFDDYGDLRPGFSLYVKEHDFDGDTIPELVVAANDGVIETYVWVFACNFLYPEADWPPMVAVWQGEGQSDLILDGNTLGLPYGSQGLIDEYVYNGISFMQSP